MTAPTPAPERIFGITAEECARTAARFAPYMPSIPVPSRWSAFKSWFRA